MKHAPHAGVRRRLTAAALVVAGVAATARADQEAPGVVRLADLVAEARQRNPELQAARERARAMAAVPARVSAYDDPVVSWEAWNFPDSFAIDRADNNIVRLSQKVPFPGKRTLAGAAAERDAEVARQAARAVELDVVAAVERAYASLWQAHETLAIYEREQALVKRLAHVAAEKYAAGGVPQADVLRAQVELTHVTSRVTTQELTIDTARAELNALLSRAPDEPLGVPEAPPAPRLAASAETLTAQALRERPEIDGETAAIAREETGLRLARRSSLPDFEFAFGRFINFGRDDGFGAMAAVTIPLAYRAKYRAGVEEASARLASAEAERRRVEDRIRREVRQAFMRARAALLQHELFVTTHIPQAEQALHVTEGAYQAGALDFLSLMDSVRAIETAHVEHVEAAGEFERTWADLERAVGAPLPRGGER